MVFLGLHIGIHDTNISLYKDGKCYYAKYERHSGIKHGVGDFTWLLDTLKSWGVDEPHKQIKHIIHCTAFFEDGLQTDNGYGEAIKRYSEASMIDKLKKEIPDTSSTETIFGRHVSFNSLSEANEIILDGSQITSTQTNFSTHNIFSSSAIDPLLWLNYNIIKEMKNNWNAKVDNVDHHKLHTYSTLRDYEQQAVMDGKGSGSRYALFNDKVFEIGKDGWPLGSYLIPIGMRMGLGTDSEINNSLDMPGKVMGLQSYGSVVEKYKHLQGVELLNYALSGYKGDAVFENKDWLDFVATTHDTIVNETMQTFRDSFNKDKPISYTGGVALNVVLNQKLKEENFDIKIPPHCGDEGLSIGALAYLGKMYDFEVKFDNYPFCQSDELPWDEVCSNTIKTTAEALAQGKTVAWYQGHGEIGPRALGNRSILMDPTIKNGKQKINEVKKREPWRPFGASVKQDQAHRFFEMTDSPFMMYNTKVKYSGIPAVTHRDGTCRHNTVTPEMNPAYYELLDEFEKLTGLPMLLNTSLNVQGEAICGTRDQAVKVFNTAKQLDQLVIGSKTWRR